MAWDKPDPALIERFDASLPGAPDVELRRMFGCPCAFTGGNMFAGVHERRLVLRLDEPGRDRAARELGAGPFTVMGRAMREYVAIEDAAARPVAEIKRWIAAAHAYARSLPAKVPKAKSSRGRPARRAGA